MRKMQALRGGMAIMFAASLLFLLPGCQGPLGPGRGAEGTGTGTVSLTVEKPAIGRAIMPDIAMADFVRFNVEFVDADNAPPPNNGSDFWLWENDGDVFDGFEDIELPEGRWYFTVTAFLPGPYFFDGNPASVLAAARVISHVDVLDNATVFVEVELLPIAGDPGAQGTFSWHLTFPPDVESGTIEVFAVNAAGEIDADAEYDWTFDPGYDFWTGSETLAAGNYYAVFTLVHPTYGTMTLGKDLHVFSYQNIESRFAEDFSQAHFRQPGDPVVVVVTPSAATVRRGQTQQFAATVTGTADTAVTWTATGVDGVSISATGLLTVALDAGNGTVTVTATSDADDTASDTATVTVPAAVSGELGDIIDVEGFAVDWDDLPITEGAVALASTPAEGLLTPAGGATITWGYRATGNLALRATGGDWHGATLSTDILEEGDELIVRGRAFVTASTEGMAGNRAIQMMTTGDPGIVVGNQAFFDHVASGFHPFELTASSLTEAVVDRDGIQIRLNNGAHGTVPHFYIDSIDIIRGGDPLPPAVQRLVGSLVEIDRAPFDTVLFDFQESFASLPVFAVNQPANMAVGTSTAGGRSFLYVYGTGIPAGDNGTGILLPLQAWSGATTLQEGDVLVIRGRTSVDGTTSDGGFELRRGATPDRTGQLPGGIPNPFTHTITLTPEDIEAVNLRLQVNIWGTRPAGFVFSIDDLIVHRPAPPIGGDVVFSLESWLLDVGTSPNLWNTSYLRRNDGAETVVRDGGIEVNRTGGASHAGVDIRIDDDADWGLDLDIENYVYEVRVTGNVVGTPAANNWQVIINRAPGGGWIGGDATSGWISETANAGFSMTYRIPDDWPSGQWGLRIQGHDDGNAMTFFISSIEIERVGSRGDP